MSDTRLAVLLTIVAIVTAIAAILITVMMWHDDAHHQEVVPVDRRATRSVEDPLLDISVLTMQGADDNEIVILSWLPKGMVAQIQLEGKHLNIGTRKIKVTDTPNLEIYHVEVNPTQVVIYLSTSPR